MPSAFAPTSSRLRPALLLVVGLGVGARLAAQTLEDFETYVVPAVGYENTQVSYLDEHTITGSGQGPGLVASGCACSGNGGTWQWNGAGY